MIPEEETKMVVRWITWNFKRYVKSHQKVIKIKWDMGKYK